MALGCSVASLMMWLCVCDDSTTLRTVVCDELANHLVFPNKISVSLMDQSRLTSLLFDMPKVCTLQDCQACRLI